MSSAIFTGKLGPNPYRSGVLIGKYVEDMFGLDLKQKYGNLRHSVDSKNISEKQDQYRWPVYKREQLGRIGNDLTMSCNMNYNLNIDFTKKNPEDFKVLKDTDELSLDNKNIFLPDEVRIVKYQKSLEDQKNNIIPKETVETQTQNALSKIIGDEAKNTLYSKKTGLGGNLLFGHGCPKNFNKNSLVSVSDLSYNQHIPTKVFLDNNNDFKSTFKLNPDNDRDYADWGYRKYREYGFFTKKFDKKKKK